MANLQTKPGHFPASPFRWPVGVSQTIEVSQEALWQAISMPGNLEPCHPFCRSNPVSRWPGRESRDEVHYLNGLIYERRFCNWIQSTGYDLRIGQRGGPESFVSWRIAAAGAGRASLRIVVYPHVLQQIPPAVRWLPHLAKVRPMLKRYLTSVVRGFDWYLTRGEPVPRNQWGSHPWFSAGA